MFIIELRVLEYFLTVAKEENISHAAQELHITQPTLSRQLAELEDEVGVKLLIRGKRKTILTDAGLLLYKRAEEIVSLTKKVKHELCADDKIVDGDIYIGCGETNAMRKLIDTAKKLQPLYPHVRYHLFSGKADDVTSRLDKGLLDFGVLIGANSVRKYSSLRFSDADAWGLLLRKDDSLAKKEFITPDDVWQLPLIVSKQALDTYELYNWLQKKSAELNIIATYNLIFNASLMVEAGLGYALCLDKLVYTGRDSNLCFRYLVPRVSAQVYFIWQKEQIFSKAARLFLNEVKISLHRC